MGVNVVICAKGGDYGGCDGAGDYDEHYEHHVKWYIATYRWCKKDGSYP